MLKKMQSVFKTTLSACGFGKTEGLDASSDLIGYFPYAHMAVANGVRFVRNDNLPFNAIHRSHPFSKTKASEIQYNLADPDAIYQLPYTKEHEGVHNNQNNLDTVRRSVIIHQPRDHIALHLTLEAEAYMRGNYSVMTNLIRGHITADTIKDHKFDTIPFMTLLDVITPDTISPWNDLDLALNTVSLSDLPSEQVVLVKGMTQLTGNEIWRTDNARRGIQELAELNQVALTILEANPKSQKKWFDETGINARSFSKRFTLENLHDIINRDGTDYFASVASEDQTKLHRNLFQLNINETTVLNSNIGNIMQLPSSYRALNKNSF